MVCYPLELLGVTYRQSKLLAGEKLLALGISQEQWNSYPTQLSGGEQQRVAIARALAKGSKVILADEPTGALDSKSTDELLDIFEDVNRMGQTIVMVTHSVKAASRAGRVMFIRDGEVFHQIYRGNNTNEEFYTKISDTLTLLANKKADAVIG